MNDVQYCDAATVMLDSVLQSNMCVSLILVHIMNSAFVCAHVSVSVLAELCVSTSESALNHPLAM